MYSAADIELTIVPEHGRPDLVQFARTLFAEYAAMPHAVPRWTTAVTDIALLPRPFIPPQGVLLVATVSGEPIGCGALRLLDPHTAELKRIYVRYHGRGTGVGRTITQTLINHAMTLGCTRARLDTAPELERAIALYRQMGFAEIPAYHRNLLPGDLSFELQLVRRMIH